MSKSELFEKIIVRGEGTPQEKHEYIEGIAAWRDAVSELPDGTTLGIKFIN